MDFRGFLTGVRAKDIPFDPLVGGHLTFEMAATSQKDLQGSSCFIMFDTIKPMFAISPNNDPGKFLQNGLLSVRT